MQASPYLLIYCTVSWTVLQISISSSLGFREHSWELMPSQNDVGVSSRNHIWCWCKTAVPLEFSDMFSIKFHLILSFRGGSYFTHKSSLIWFFTVSLADQYTISIWKTRKTLRLICYVVGLFNTKYLLAIWDPLQDLFYFAVLLLVLLCMVTTILENDFI